MYYKILYSNYIICVIELELEELEELEDLDELDDKEADLVLEKVSVQITLTPIFPSIIHVNCNYFLINLIKLN